MVLTRFVDTVPFKINVWEGATRARPGYMGFTLSTGFGSLDSYLRWISGWSSFEMPFLHNGWTQENNSCIIYGRLLAVDVLKKDFSTAYHANESDNPYSGHNKSCFFSESLASLERLCADWGFNVSLIKRDQLVEQFF